MGLFSPSFLYAGGPLLVLCVVFGWTPYFFHSSSWNDAKINDPIKIALQSSLYNYSLVAGISASFPPFMELIFYSLVSRRNSAKLTILILANMAIFIFPESIYLILVSPYSDRSLTNSLAPYFVGNMGIWIHKLGIFLQFIGCLLFIFKSCKFLITNSAATESQDMMIANELLCKFITMSFLFIIIGFFCVYLSAGLPYWTQRSSTYIACYNIIISLPNVIIGVALAHATRNETVYLQHAKQMFINYISHEMRTSLNTAVMGLQYLRSELIKVEANDDEIMITLDEVRVACETSVSILTEMLDFDKLQSGHMKMELEDIFVRDFLEEIVSPFYVQANLKGIILECNLDNVALNCLFVSVDKSKFAQVIRNLLSNALKFTPVGGTIIITATVAPFPLPLSPTATTTTAGLTFPISQQQPLLKIEVIDNGVGISKDNQKKLFKEMVQFNPGKLQSGGGTGLGLYISKGIIDLLHGTLSIQSEGEGHGCTFTIAILAKYINNTLTVELPEYKVEEDNENEERIAIRVGSTKSSNNNNSNINNWISNVNSLNNEILHTHTSSIEVSSGRFSKLRRTDSLRSIGTTKVTPLFRTNSVRSIAGASVCGEISQEVCNYGTNGIKLLIVDDSKSNRKMLVRLLRNRCTVIGEAIDGIDAVHQIKEILEANDDEPSRQYDAILMDFIMPNMETPEAAQEIRKLGYQGLIIGITGNVLPVDKERFVNQGANIVLTKPVNINDIDMALATILYPLTTTTTTTTTSSMHLIPPFDL